MRSEPLIPSRLKVGILGCLGCTLLYLLRSNLSVAIIAMVDEKDVILDEENGREGDLCYDIKAYNKTESQYRGKYQWSESVQGIILGSYFYGYTSTQILGSFADKFGAKWMCGLGIFIPAVCNALIPVLADIHYSFVIVMRLLMGAFHGVVYSSLFSMFAKWFPQNEKNLAITGTTFAGNFGGIITAPLVGYLVGTSFLNGWPTVFYLTSIVHIIWFLFWIFCVSNTPEEDPNISDSELKHIHANNPNAKKFKKLSIPWRQILTSKVVWASVVAKTTGSFGYYLLCTNMPQYLDSVFGLAIQRNSWFNSLMYLTLCVALLTGGPLSTWIKSKGWFSQTRNRKNFQSLSMFGCAICLLLVPIVGCNSNAVIALLLVGAFVYGFITGGEYGVIPEYAPDYSGTIFGLANTLASSGGFLGPMLVGYLLEHGDGSIRGQWNIIWYLAAAVYIFGGVFYEIFGTSKPQSWAVVADQIDNKQKKISIVSQHYRV